MLVQFNRFIEKEKLLAKKDRILLAVSGGVDSVVMCELFHLAGFKFGIAHCNFNLRGKESDGDEQLVKSLAEKYTVPFHVQSFLTEEYSKEKSISIQMAARELRYKWLEEVRKINKYQYIAAAHHKDDSIETFFINLVRGTGISGLHGILPKQRFIVRPLLFASKKEIEDFAKTNNLSYREDSSNRSDKYLRNKIRHQIIPVLKEINPDIDKVILDDIAKIKDVESVYRQAIERSRKEVIRAEGFKRVIAIKKLKTLKPLRTYLFEFLKEYNFNPDVVHAIAEAIDSNSGKQFYSSTHRLVKDRDFLIITARNKQAEKFLLRYSLKSFKGFRIPSGNDIACMDYDLLKLPLEIRKWRNGDFFYPLGMNKRKKISDFLIDNKVSVPDKENVHVLTSGKDIVWVIGRRVDNRFRVTDKTERIYVCKLYPNK